MQIHAGLGERLIDVVADPAGFAHLLRGQLRGGFLDLRAGLRGLRLHVVLQGLGHDALQAGGGFGDRVFTGAFGEGRYQVQFCTDQHDRQTL
ncbi:hypothetical protein D3C84_922820 [compost metagenome]